HVVHHPVPIRREAAQVVDANVQQSLRDCPRHDPLLQRPLDHAREDRHDVELHNSNSPFGGSITMILPAGSMLVQMLSTIGTCTSPPSRATTRRLRSSVPSTPVTFPTTAPSVV